MSDRSPMFARFVRSLGIREAERRTMGMLLLVFGLSEAGRGLGMNASDALFFLRFGVDRLPWMYMGLGALTSLAIVLYAAGLARYRWRFLPPLYGVLALILAGERLLIPLGSPAIYPALWLSVQVFSWVLVTASWGLASQSFDTRQSKRLFPLLASASIAGSIMGNALTGGLARTIGTENLFLVHALLLLVAFQSVRRLTDGESLPPAARPRDEGSLSALRVGARVLKRNRLLQLIAGSSVLFSVLFFSVWFPFSKVVSASFPDEVSLAGFLGNFTSLVMLSTLLLSLFSGRIYARIGVVNVLLAIPLIYLAGFGLWLIEFSLVTAVVLRFAHLVWINGAGWTAWNALFNVYHSEEREQLRAFESGVPAQIGTSLSGVLLLFGERGLSNPQIFLVGASAAVVCGMVCWWMRPAYGQALLRAIRSGLVDVFTGSPGRLVRLGADAQARRTARTALADPNPSLRRTAARLLGRMGAHEEFDLLVGALGDEVPSVRQAAVEGLRGLDGPDAAAAIRPLLVDPSVEVREAAVRALADLAGPTDGWPRQALEDESPVVRAEAAAQIHVAGEGGEGQRLLADLLAADDPRLVNAALRVACRRRIELPLETLARLAEDRSVTTRRLAVEALSLHRSSVAEGLVLGRLGDQDDRVRQAATASARRIGVDSRALLEHLKAPGPARAQRAALAAIEIESKEERQALIDWALEQMEQLELLKAAALCLTDASGDHGPAERLFLLDLVERRGTERTEVILQALSKLAPNGTIPLVERGLTSGVRELQTQALEALDTLGEPRIVRGLLPLLEGEPGPTDSAALDQVLSRLSDSPDPWIRGFARRLRAGRLRRELDQLQAEAADDPSEIVQELWAERVTNEGAPMSETLDTLSTMDRILYLRQIPIFDDLDPEDLHSIAQIAGERTIPEGGYLCQEGDLEDELFLIVGGEVSVTKADDGAQKELRRLGPGQPVGELAILAQQPRSATVRAIGGEVRALVIGGKAFQSILRDRPGVAGAMLANMARRLGAMT